MAPEPGAARRLRVLLYGQHLSGVGHYVRLHEIARALADDHDVHLVEGGRPVPRAGGGRIHRVDLPGLVRRAGRIVPLDPVDGDDPAPVLRERARQLEESVAALRPDVLVVEYHPFGRWDSEAEVLGLVAAARARSPGVRVVCSVRDIPRRTAWDGAASEASESWAARVLDRLHRGYDGVMVHADPRRSPFPAAFPEWERIRVPLATTGLVAERCVPDERAARAIRQRTGGVPYVLASAGGGGDPGDLLGRVADAWPRARAAAPLAGHVLVLATGLLTASDWPPARVEALRRRCGAAPALVLGFAEDFLQWLRLATVSVSCAGYNTCANVLETRARAVLVPSPVMPDQQVRAAFLAGHGVARCLPVDVAPDALADALAAAAGDPPPRHDFDLGGAAGARRFIELLAG